MRFGHLPEFAVVAGRRVQQPSEAVIMQHRTPVEQAPIADLRILHPSRDHFRKFFRPPQRCRPTLNQDRTRRTDVETRGQPLRSFRVRRDRVPQLPFHDVLEVLPTQLQFDHELSFIEPIGVHSPTDTLADSLSAERAEEVARNATPKVPVNGVAHKGFPQLCRRDRRAVYSSTTDHGQQGVPAM